MVFSFFSASLWSGHRESLSLVIAPYSKMKMSKTDSIISWTKTIPLVTLLQGKRNIINSPSYTSIPEKNEPISHS